MITALIIVVNFTITTAALIFIARAYQQTSWPHRVRTVRDRFLTAIEPTLRVIGWILLVSTVLAVVVLFPAFASAVVQGAFWGALGAFLVSVLMAIRP